VQSELDLQRNVSQQFSQTVGTAQGMLNEKIDALKQQQEAGEITKAEYAQKLKQLQHSQVFLNMVAAALSAPTDSAAGIAAATAAPAISYGIGQEFKKHNQEGSATHIASHMALGAVVSALGGNDAVSGALAAGGAEALVPLFSKAIYGTTDPEKLTAEDKQNLSNMARLFGAAVGAATSNGAANGYADVAQGLGNAQNAINNNYLTQSQTVSFEKELAACQKNDIACAEQIFAKYRSISRENSENMHIACSRGDGEGKCATTREEIYQPLRYVLDENYNGIPSERRVSNLPSYANLEDGSQQLQNITITLPWQEKAGYDITRFIVWENLNDIAYLEPDRSKAAAINRYLYKTSFNHTNQPNSLFRSSDILHWANGKYNLGKEYPKLGELPYQVINNELKGDQAWYEHAASAIQNIDYAAKNATNHVVFGTIDGVKGLIELPISLYQNRQEIVDGAERLISDPEYQQQTINAISEGAEHKWQQASRAVSNSFDAVRQGNYSDVLNDASNVIGEVVGIGGAGKVAGTASKSLSSTVRNLGGKAFNEVENAVSASKRLARDASERCFGLASCQLATATPEGIHIPRQPENLPRPIESRAHNNGSSTGGKGSTSSKGSSSADSLQSKSGSASKHVDEAVGQATGRAAQVSTVYEQAVRNRSGSLNAELAHSSNSIIRDGSHLDKKGKLKPNVTYQAGEFEYLYQTDHLGRLKTWDAQDLQLTERAKRLYHNPNTPGKLKGDHSGHLAGDRFGGSPKLDNLVSQLQIVNLSSYKVLENKWADALAKGQHVKVNVGIEYTGNNLRPDKFVVKYEIDGLKQIETILNE
jgi:putative uncharacterized protein (fragment)